MFELIANIALFIFLGYSYFTHVLEAKVPKSFTKNPNNLMPDVWPKIIILLLLLCLAINIVRIVKKNKGKEDFNFKSFLANSKGFFMSKTFLGMVILFAAALLIETLGFVVTTFLILFAYGLLLGEKKVVRLLLVSAVLSIAMHFIFSGLLDVTLPRGTVPFLRNFALWLENLI